jgi:hypothetical protein
METFRLKDRIEGLAELTIVVVDQEAKGIIIFLEFPIQLSGWLSNPDLIGIGSDTSYPDLARTQFNEEDHIDCLKSDGF